MAKDRRDLSLPQSIRTLLLDLVRFQDPYVAAFVLIASDPCSSTGVVRRDAGLGASAFDNHLHDILSHRIVP